MSGDPFATSALWAERDKRVDFLDVSGFQPPIDWRKVVLSGFRGVAIKATEGISFRDRRFAEHFREATKAKLRIWLYHFFRPEQDVKRQVEGLWNALEEIGQMPHRFVLDAETAPAWMTPRELARKILEFNDAWKPYGYQDIILYSYQSFLRERLAAAAKAEPRLVELPLWMAQYPKGFVPYLPQPEDDPPSPEPWPHWIAWQYSGNGGARVPGVSVGQEVDVDRNLFHGDWADFWRFNGLPDPVPDERAFFDLPPEAA
jgi:lysozyme